MATRNTSQKTNKPFFSLKSKKIGQSVLEYSLVIFCIMAALLAMKTYVTRGVQGRLRGAVDNLGEQYAPLQTTSDISVIIDTDIDTVTNTIEENGEKYTETKTTYNHDTQIYTGIETMENASKSRSPKGLIGSVKSIIDKIF